MTLVIASSISSILIFIPFLLAVRSAASLSMFSISAGENPGVLLASTLGSTPSSSGLFLECTLKISSLPTMSGMPITICLSNLPGLSSAGSSTSGLLVAARIMIPVFSANPSISTSSWLRVCSLSSWPPPRPAPLLRPTASISSMNTMQGAFFLACSNKSLTLDAPTPTNISTKSEPEIVKNGTPASPAVALEMYVLPVPGGPTSSIPLGILAPRLLYLIGCLRKSTISSSSSFSSLRPATSLNVIFL